MKSFARIFAFCALACAVYAAELPPLQLDVTANRVLLGGSIFSFDPATTSYTSPTGDRLTRVAEDGGWRLVRSSGRQARFDAGGNFISASAAEESKASYRPADDIGDDGQAPDASAERALGFLEAKGKVAAEGGKPGWGDDGGAEVTAVVGEDLVAREQVRRDQRDARLGAHESDPGSTVATVAAEDPLDKLINSLSQVGAVATSAGDAYEETQDLDRRMKAAREDEEVQDEINLEPLAPQEQ